MTKLPWFSRAFNFDYPVERWPDILERFRGTPARIEDKVTGLSRDLLTRRDGRTWSIQENIGHLLDLEPLFDGRLDDFLAGREVLRAADVVEQERRAVTDEQRDRGAIDSHGDGLLNNVANSLGCVRLMTEPGREIAGALAAVASS